MKNMGKVVLFVLCCFCLCPFYTLAKDGQAEIDLTIDIAATPAYAAIVSLEADLLRQMNSLVEGPATKPLPRSVDFSKTVKVYILEEMNTDGITAAIAANTFFYRVPLHTDEGFMYATIMVKDGAVSGSGTTATRDTSLGQASYLFDAALVSGAISKQSLAASDVAVINIPYIWTDFIYCKAGGREYAIPFASRPDFLGLRNGEVYELDTFFDAANALRDELAGGQNGGGYAPKSGAWWWVTAAGVCVIAISGLAFLAARRANEIGGGA